MKKAVRILLIVLAFVIPSAVYALSATPAITCNNTTLAPNGSTNCSVYVTVNSGGLKGIDATLSVSNDLTLSSLSAAAGWNGNANGNRILLYTDVSKTGRVEIASFAVAANSSMASSQSITLNVSGYSDENDNDAPGTSISLPINYISTNNKLSSLSLSNGTLSPAFSPDTYEYSATVNSDTTFIGARTQDPNARISGIGTTSVRYGTNRYAVMVTAESGATQNYVISITRPDDRSSDNTLKSLKVSNTNITFDKNKTSYSTTVENSVAKVNITATPNDSKARVSGTGEKLLKVGRNTFTVTVTAENGSTKDYTIAIDRKSSSGEVNVNPETLSGNAYLKSITIDKYSNLKFDKNTDTYSITLDEKIDKVKITYSVEDSKASATMDSDGKLKMGNNEITITVVAENGTTKKYVLKIKRGNYVNNTEKDILDAIKSTDSGNVIKVQVDKGKLVNEIPSSIIDALKNSNKELIYVIVDETKTLYSVKVSKEDNTYNYSLLFESKNSDKLDKLVKNNWYLPLVLENSAALDFTVNMANTSLKKYNEFDLYYYDEELNELVLVKEGIKSKDGDVELKIDSSHEYVLLAHGVDFSEEAEVVEEPTKEAPSFMKYGSIALFVVDALMVVAIVVLIAKKKKKQALENSEQV